MSITPLATRPHDHSHCVHSALAEADALCARQGLRLTALRRRVLELVWQSHKPLGAYDILAVLSEQDVRRAAPPKVSHFNPAPAPTQGGNPGQATTTRS